MPRKARWTISPIEDGVCEVQLYSWKYFMDFIYIEMLAYDAYIWRGQRCSDWELHSTLDRLTNTKGIPKRRLNKYIEQHLERFQYASRGRRGNNPRTIDDENDWWALGQHHGLATPLLDWTTSPFVAAYFSFIGFSEQQTDHRAVYALQRLGIETKAQDIKEEKELENKKELLAHVDGTKKIKNSLRLRILEQPVKLEIEFIRPMSDENQRLVNQGGLFTRSPIGESLESWIKHNYAGDKEKAALIKILIPNKDRMMCLRMLNRMNINHLSLFPDLYGASKFSNIHSEIDRY